MLSGHDVTDRPLAFELHGDDPQGARRMVPLRMSDDAGISGNPLQSNEDNQKLLVILKLKTGFALPLS